MAPSAFAPQSVMNRSKPILDEAVTMLVERDGFTADGLDFTLYYYDKYHLGRDTGGEED